MRPVAVLGIGQTKVEEQWDKSLRELAGDAVLAAMQDAGVQTANALFVGNMMSGSASHQQHLGSYIADWVGLRFAEAARVEAACSSGAAAFRSALIAVASGEVDIAIAVGVEKMTDSPAEEITAQLATAADADWELDMGLSFVALNALIMRRYMDEYKWDKVSFAPFSINSHANAVHNPYARFQEPITEEQFRKATMVAEPICVMDASPMGDGAAAAVLVPADLVRSIPGRPRVKVIGSGAATDSIAIHGRREPLWLRGAELSAKAAYNQAGITPQEIDLFELHDAFSIMAALSLEATGFAERGQAPRLALDGEIRPNGRIPICTLGGLKRAVIQSEPPGCTKLLK